MKSEKGKVPEKRFWRQNFGWSPGVLHKCHICAIRTKMEALNTKLRPKVQAAEKPKALMWWIMTDTPLFTMELQSLALLCSAVRLSDSVAQLASPTVARKLLPSPQWWGRWELSESKETQATFCTAVGFTDEATWRSNFNSTSLEKMERRSLVAEVSAVSPPSCIESFQPVNVAFPCQIQTLYAFCMKTSPFPGLRKRTCQAEQYKLCHCVGQCLPDPPVRKLIPVTVLESSSWSSRSLTDLALASPVSAFTQSKIEHLHCLYFSPSLTSSALSPPPEAVLSLLAQHPCSVAALLPLPGLLFSSVIQRRARRESGKPCPCHCQPSWKSPWLLTELLPGQCCLLRVPIPDPTSSSSHPARWDKPCTTEPWLQGLRWGYFHHHWVNRFS